MLALMEAETVRVSGFVTERQHAQLVSLARRRKTTVGNIVSFGVKNLLGDLRQLPDLASKIPPDGRRRHDHRGES